MSFAQFMTLITCSVLPNSTLKLLTFISNRVEKKPGPFWVNQSLLAKHLGCSRSTVGRNLRRLVETGFLGSCPFVVGKIV